MNPQKELSLFELFPCYISLMLCLFFRASSCASERQRTGFVVFRQQQSRGGASLSLADSMLRWIGLRHAKIAVVQEENDKRYIRAKPS